MARKARQRISYVLPLANSPGGHRLGVNSLAVGPGVLYSAGRDGVICSWNIGTDVPEKWSELRPTSTFRHQIQAHTHWVNDLVLCNSNEVVVSCSSDLTVKLWRPNSDSSSHQADTIGVHSDYVKCLAAPKGHTDWVASGGLDRKIKFWDLNGKGEKLQIDVGDEGSNPKGSIYSLGIGGGILASGGPEGVVRLWDPRDGKRITKFVGHTENVRSILVSDQGNLVLTASSDATIKLWSLTAGRCLHTLSMHNDSVWSLHSSHPGLEIFHSSDRSGLLAKTDVRNVAELEDGICVAVCQEKCGINKVVVSGDYFWTATSSSSINRWKDVDTNSELVADIRRPRQASSASSRPPVAPTTRNTTIPISSLLRMSTSSSFPKNVRDPDAVTVYSVASVRQTSLTETLMEGDIEVVPLNDYPEETIEGQRGLLKHFLLNDRRRVLTVDTAGEVVMWDLLKCIPIKSYGERHLEDVAMEINTTDTIANWCQVDTRTGKLACVLEENYCFDAEMYADEAEIDETLEFKDDQRINLGKWVLRYLFSNLIDEEIRRDEQYRKAIEKEYQERLGEQLPSLIMPPAFSISDFNPSTPTGKTAGGYMNPLFPQTPGIGLAATPFISTPSCDTDGTNARSSMERHSDDYFSSTPGTTAPNLLIPKNGAATEATAYEEPSGEKEKEEKDSSLFGKWRSFGTKKYRSISVDMNGAKTPVPAADEKSSEEITDKPDPLEEMLGGVVKRIRTRYDTHYQETPEEPIISIINPSLPLETPVLKPPANTEIIVQEDKPDFGGVADLYRGTVGSVGQDASLLESVAPAWLGELILLNHIPVKDTIKVSFVMVPWQDELPVLPSESGCEGKNSRLNANRMLRARKILGYVAERLQPPYLATSYCPEVEEGQEPPRIEDWLELLCNNQIVPPTMTLATMRSHVWKMGGDVVLYYRRKEQPPAFGIKAPSENGESSENGGSSSASTIVMARDGHGEVPL